MYLNMRKKYKKIQFLTVINGQARAVNIKILLWDQPQLVAALVWKTFLDGGKFTESVNRVFLSGIQQSMMSPKSL